MSEVVSALHGFSGPSGLASSASAAEFCPGCHGFPTYSQWGGREQSPARLPCHAVCWWQSWAGIRPGAFSSAMEKEAEELRLLLSGSGGRRTCQAPKFARGRAMPWTPPAQMDCLRLGRKVLWSEEAESPLGQANAPAQVEGQCVAASQAGLWLEAVEGFPAILPAL